MTKIDGAREREDEAEREGKIGKRGTRGYSSVKSTVPRVLRGMEQLERAGRAESRRRGDEWVLRESAYIPRSLHPPSRPRFFFFFARPPTLQPLSPMAPQASGRTVSLTRGVLLDYDRKMPKSSTRRLVSLSFILPLIFFLFSSFLSVSLSFFFFSFFLESLSRREIDLWFPATDISYL